jgi:transcriptional regulator with XRE-family HTH domain
MVTPRKPRPARSRLDRWAARNATASRRALGGEFRRCREDIGVSLSRLAAMAGTPKSYLHEVEEGDANASIDVLARLATALGGRLSVRFEPGAGPRLRDHLQAAMLQALLASLHPRWRRLLEVGVTRPVRGWIDVVLVDRDAGVVIAGEAHSQILRLEQQLRWARAKSDAMVAGGASELAAVLGRPDGSRATVSQLLLLRSTRATRAALAAYPDLMTAAYPGSHAAAVAALLGEAPWPGSSLVWMQVEAGTARILRRPPRP